MNLSNEPFKFSAPLAPRADYRHSRRNGNTRACDSASAACSRWSGGRCAMREHGPCSSIGAGCSSACSASSESRKDAARLESVRAGAGAHENARRGAGGGPIRLVACFLPRGAVPCRLPCRFSSCCCPIPDSGQHAFVSSANSRSRNRCDASARRA